MRSVVLLGPQQATMEVGRTLSELGVTEPVTLVTAGWQERETEDEALVAQLGVPAVNLRLHARTDERFAKDPELKVAYQARQELLRHLQDFYRVRLDYADDAARAIAVRLVEPELLEQEHKHSIDELRHLDRDHVRRCQQIHATFDARWKLAERQAVARHRQEIRDLISPTAALVIAGGHVASLLNRLKLFDVLSMIGPRPVIAWSAGAMVLTERIVLFHDYPPYGKDIAQVLDAGFGLAPGLVVLPDPGRRIRRDDLAGIARFAQRMAPSTCVAMGHGTQVVFENGQVTRALVDSLQTTGVLERGWAG